MGVRDDQINRKLYTTNQTRWTVGSISADSSQYSGKKNNTGAELIKKNNENKDTVAAQVFQT